jgi:hypothetical protein
MVAVYRTSNWAAKLGYIEGNSVRGVEKPEPERRNSQLPPDNFALRVMVNGQPFADLLTFAY